MQADHERTECKDFDGAFQADNVPPPTCTSPIGMCTHGRLGPDFPADYDFTFSTLQSTEDPTDPTAFVYTGHSKVTSDHDHGVISTNDVGIVHIPPDGGAPFVTTAVAFTGTGRFAGVAGAFVASGTLDFSTGHSTGTYFARLCTPEHNHCWR
ncbi:MAG: hypothetical protein ACRELY_16670 [Polyangiaceae bacterium]